MEEIKIIQTSDIHGCFFPCNLISGEEATFSLANAKTYINRIREKNKESTILVDSGDILQGNAICYFSNFVDTANGNLAAKVMNELEYDAATIGNHDIEAGHPVYDGWKKQTKFPILAANIIRTDNGKPYFKPYHIIDKLEIRICFLGMVTPAIVNWLDNQLWDGMAFEDIMESSEHWITEIKRKENPDYIIGLFHSGWDGGLKTEKEEENQTKAVASEIAGFDAILFGHDHISRIENVFNHKSKRKVICINPGSNAHNLGELTISIDKYGNSSLSGRLIDTEKMPSDKEFITIFENDITKAIGFLDTPIGRTDIDLNTYDCYFGNAPLSDLIHDIQLKLTNADISAASPLTYNETIKRGIIRMSDAFRLYTYENQIYTMKMTGREIIGFMEMTYELWINTMNSHDKHLIRLTWYTCQDGSRKAFPTNLAYNFSSFSGIEYTVDATEEYGNRIHIKRMSSGQDFRENKWYKVAVNSYLGNGGCGFLTTGAGIPSNELKKRILARSKHDQRYYFIKKIQEAKKVVCKKASPWNFVPKDYTNEAIYRDRMLLFGASSNTTPTK